MPAPFGVKVAERSDATPPKGQVSAVAVAAGDGSRAKVEGSGAPDAVRKVSLKGGVVVEEFVEVILVVHIQLGSPRGEGRAREASNPFKAVLRQELIKLLAVSGGVR